MKLTSYATYLSVAVVLCGCASSAPPSAGELTPLQGRITDQAIARDRALFDAWSDRLEHIEVGQSPARQYQHAKAGAWIDLGRGEYEVNDRTGIVESAFDHARRLIERLESGQRARIFETLVLNGSVRLREDLWSIAEDVKDSPGFRCAAASVARLEVKLVWAGNESLTCGPDDPRHHLAAAEEAAREAQRLATSCAAEGLPRPALSAGVSKPAIRSERAGTNGHSSATRLPARLVVPNVIHFAFDKAYISEESAAILRRIAEVVQLYPELRVVMFGHADKRGGVGYNFTLARRRAHAARDYLVSIGTDPSQLRVVSEGKASLTRTGASDLDHAHNRRVEFAFYTALGRRIETVSQATDLQLENDPQSN